MKDNEKEQGAQNEGNQENPNEKQTLPSNWREEIEKRYPNLKIIDVTEEWEGKTTLIFPVRCPPQKIKDDEQ